MTTSQTISELSAALVAVHAELPGGVTFDATNPFLKNKYATLGALIDASRETLAKHGLAIVQHPTSVEGGVAVQTTILHKSGEFISDTVAISMQDEKGKSMAQVAGSIITYLRRYAYASVLGLYGEEDTDGNAPPQKPATANPRANTGTPARPAPQPTTRPAARTAEPSKPVAATEDQKQRFIEMVSPIEDSAIELFQKWGWLEPDQVLEDLTLDHVPTTQKLAAALINDIQAFMDGGVAGDPPWTPAGKPTSPTVNPQEFQEPFWNIIIPVPRRGEKRADYMKNPDTIRSLYEAGKGGDDDARKRLFGFANNWEPTGWEKRDGTKMPPSEADNAARAALDQFLEWEKEKEQ